MFFSITADIMESALTTSEVFMADKRLLALILTLIMAFSFSACRRTPTPQEEDPSSVPTATPAPEVDILATATPVPDSVAPISSDEETSGDLVFNDILSGVKSDFNSAASVSDTGWSRYHSGNVSLSPDGVDGTQCIKYSDTARDNNRYSYSCPTVNLYNYLKKAGTYKISFAMRLGGEDVDMVAGTGFKILIRGNGAKDENSFIAPDKQKKNYRFDPNAAIDGFPGEWMDVGFELSVRSSDIDNESHGWFLCMHTIDENIGEIYIDNFRIAYAEPAPEKEKLVDTAETWLANEMTFLANKTVADPVGTQTLDVTFTNGSKSLTIPGFWDGDNIWRVRFALPEEGTWTFTTAFSDKTDSGVHEKTGSINVMKYSGNLEIYKRGFVKTDPDKHYFTYADGTPFFYLGDTHWNFLTEEYDKAGSRSTGSDTTSHFKYIVNKRVAQGYTVYQTEPLGASFDFTDGITAKDIQGLKNADKYFKYIASQGLVHANSQFFFSSTMNEQIMAKYSKAEYEKLLDTLSRYWVARFGAYPVMYTLAQEVDNDYYYNENTKSNTTMTAENNPWKYVCECMYKYDAYKNPISAHQEGAKAIINFTTASNSAFREITGHSWWASQWKPVLDSATNFSGAKDYWVNGQGKPAVVYEGRYDGLWTNEYGARAQGWLAFLNGMYGHGYGAVDIWLYNSTYDIDKDTVRDGITISTKTKSTPWGESIEYASGYQMSYMKRFLEKYEWWNLVPAFDSKDIFDSSTGFYSVAHTNNDLYIAYFYDDISSAGSRETGTFKGLDGEYTYSWFNPRTTAMSNPRPADVKDGCFAVGERPSAEDWVLVLQKTK